MAGSTGSIVLNTPTLAVSGLKPTAKLFTFINLQMKTYFFQKQLNEPQRDSIVLTLRKAGFSASRETKTMRTNASPLSISICYGTCPVDLVCDFLDKRSDYTR